MLTGQIPILQLALRPGLLDLAWGHPDATLLPLERIRQASALALERYGSEALMYGYDPGNGVLIDWLAERIARTEGRAVAPEAIVITGGASHALDQICTLLTRPGDTMLVETPTYHLAVRVLRDHPLDLVPIPIDSDGIDPDRLRRIIADLRRTGRRPRMLYTIPTFHNPTGVCLAPDRRRALLELAAAEELTIIEDDVYRELAYDGPPPPSLWSMDTAECVLRIGSFAKSLAPGLRLGWITGPATLVQRIVRGGLLDSGGAANHFAAMVVAMFCTEGWFDPQTAAFRAAYRTRRDALAQALATHLPDTFRWVVPGGGFFLWIRLPDDLHATAFSTHAETHGIGFLPGTRSALDGHGEHAIRLAFSLYPPDQLAEAARRLGMAATALP